jgi:hypothetical protein
MARLGGLFHVFRTIPDAFKKKPRFGNALHEFRQRLPNPVKNSAAQNWHKAAQKIVATSCIDQSGNGGPNHSFFCEITRPTFHPSLPFRPQVPKTLD